LPQPSACGARTCRGLACDEPGSVGRRQATEFEEIDPVPLAPSPRIVNNGCDVDTSVSRNADQQQRRISHGWREELEQEQ
jgi:hypothetical protein